MKANGLIGAVFPSTPKSAHYRNMRLAAEVQAALLPPLRLLLSILSKNLRGRRGKSQLKDLYYQTNV